MPFGWLTGDVRLEVEVNNDRAVAETNYGNNTTSFNARFVDGGDLRIAWLPIHYVTGGYTGPADPSARVAKGDAWLKATWPVSHTRVKYYPWPGITWGGNVNVGSGGIKLLNYLNRLLQLSQTRPRPDHVYGWLPTSVSGSNGLGWYPGQTAFGNDTDGRWRRTFAHELGHNRNIGHWDATIRFHGFDVAAREVREDTKLDFMVPGRLENEAWIAPELYTYLHGKIATAAGQDITPAQAVADEYLLASGLINQDGAVSFDAFYRQAQTDPLDNPPDGTAYCLELYDAGNTKLSSQCFDVSYGFGDSTTPVTTAPFALTVPYPPTAKKIVLNKGGATVATRMISNNGPTVSVSLPGGGLVKTVNWTANDLDGDTLSYSVLYSNDNKQSWYAVATDLNATTYGLDTGTLPGGTNAYVRILATDGVNTAHSDAGPFVVTGKPPTAVINSPISEAVFAPGENVLLAGDGFDPEDDSLPDGSLIWTSDQNGALGSGRTLERSNLREGKHTITLTVMDSHGNQATDSITVYIRRPSSLIYLPLVMKGLPVTPTPTPTVTRVPTLTPTAPASSGIYGRVTYHGMPAPHLFLTLSHWDGANWTTRDVTVTETDGRYTFADAATLGAGEIYSVDYENTPGQPNPGPSYLWSWSGNRIAAYIAGQSVAGGDFDVADIPLVSPADGASVTLPSTFCWASRGIAGDNYRLVLWYPDEDDTVATAYLGDTSCVVLTELPSGWPSGASYRWWVRVYRGSNPQAAPYNVGVSYGDRAATISFSASARGEGAEGPPQFVPLDGDTGAGKVNA